MSLTEAVDTWIKLGIEELISYRVCSLIPPFVLRNVAHQNTLKHKSMVVESKADEFLTIYERPNAREFISACKEHGDLIVYTLSNRDYAELVCDKLNINPVEIVAGLTNYSGLSDIQKSIKSSWYKNYWDIVVVDDSPELWRSSDREKARFIVPPEFTGDARDDAWINFRFIGHSYDLRVLD